jgi:hypothetical protein
MPVIGVEYCSKVHKGEVQMRNKGGCGPAAVRERKTRTIKERRVASQRDHVRTDVPFPELGSEGVFTRQLVGKIA